jgi:hypothetical protein
VASLVQSVLKERRLKDLAFFPGWLKTLALKRSNTEVVADGLVIPALEPESRE